MHKKTTTSLYLFISLMLSACSTIQIENRSPAAASEHHVNLKNSKQVSDLSQQLKQLPSEAFCEYEFNHEKMDCHSSRTYCSTGNHAYEPSCRFSEAYCLMEPSEIREDASCKFSEAYCQIGNNSFQETCLSSETHCKIDEFKYEESCASSEAFCVIGGHDVLDSCQHSEVHCSKANNKYDPSCSSAPSGLIHMLETVKIH